MSDKSHEELATDLTIAWIKANSELKGINGVSTPKAMPISMVQNGYLAFLKTIDNPSAFNSSK